MNVSLVQTSGCMENKAYGCCLSVIFHYWLTDSDSDPTVPVSCSNSRCTGEADEMLYSCSRWKLTRSVEKCLRPVISVASSPSALVMSGNLTLSLEGLAYYIRMIVCVCVHVFVCVCVCVCVCVWWCFTYWIVWKSYFVTSTISLLHKNVQYVQAGSMHKWLRGQN